MKSNPFVFCYLSHTTVEMNLCGKCVPSSIQHESLDLQAGLGRLANFCLILELIFVFLNPNRDVALAQSQ